MSKKGLDLRFNQIRVVVKDVSIEAINALAFQTAGQAQVNITDTGMIDTGFARNSIAAVPAGGRALPAEQRRMQNRQGDMVDRASLGLPASKSDEALVGIAADYGAILEIRHPFLFPAAEQVGKSAGGTVQRIARKKGLDGK